MTTRAWLSLFLLLAPAALYSRTVVHEYGFRDDYANLREVREEPGKIARFTASDGRPLYGALLEYSFRPVLMVQDLPLLRLTGVALLSLAGLVLWWRLVVAGWSDIEAMAVGLGISLLPGAQVIAGWATIWPDALAMLLALVGFAAVEAGLHRQGAVRAAGFAGASACYLVAGITYQSNVLFAIVPLTAVLMVRPGREFNGHLRWLAIHLVTLMASLATALLVMKIIFLRGVLPASHRTQLEMHLLAKLAWFFSQPLPNALALIALRDTFDTGVVWFWSSAALVVALVGAGLHCDVARKDSPQGVKWLVCSLLLPLVAHAVSLAAAWRSIGYRTLLPLGGLVLVLLVYSLRSLRATHRISPSAQHAALLLMLLVAGICASRNAFLLIAEPQGREWALVRDAVGDLALKPDTSVYIITPLLSDRTTKRVFADEFGSLSSNSDWVPKEMFKTAMRARFRGGLPAGSELSLDFGAQQPPAGEENDLVIDMRRLRDQRDW